MDDHSDFKNNIKLLIGNRCIELMTNEYKEIISEALSIGIPQKEELSKYHTFDLTQASLTANEIYTSIREVNNPTKEYHTLINKYETLSGHKNEENLISYFIQTEVELDTLHDFFEEIIKDVQIVSDHQDICKLAAVMRTIAEKITGHIKDKLKIQSKKAKILPTIEKYISERLQMKVHFADDYKSLHDNLSNILKINQKHPPSQEEVRIIYYKFLDIFFRIISSYQNCLDK